MDEKLSESMSEEHFANIKGSQDGGDPGGTGGQGHWDGQSDQGQGQAVSDVMIESVGPDELGKSLLVEEVDNVQPKLAVQPFKSPPPKVVIAEVFNLTKLLENIEKCGRYRFIVVNATADKANVLVKTQNALFDVLKLCDVTSLIIQNFQSGAGNILEKLRVACLYLQDGFPDFAMTDIESTKKDILMMQERCEKTLKKVPGEYLPSMDETIMKDAEERGSALPEDIASDLLQSLVDSVCLSSDFGNETAADSSKVHGSFIAPDEMQRSVEWIEEVSNKNDQYAQLVDEEKAHELKGLVAAVEEQLTSPLSDTPAHWGDIVYTSDDEEGMSMEYVPPVEDVLKMIAEDESKCNYHLVAKILSAIWNEVKDYYIILVYKFLGYKEPLATTNPEKDQSQSTDVENNARSVAKRQDVIDNIDSYMRAKLVSKICNIVTELYEDIRKVIKNALDLAEKWYQECKTLVQPVMKLNVEKTQGMSKAEQEKFWQTCDPEFADKAEAYLRRWSELQEYCEGHRKDIRKLRQVIEGYYIDNPYPREAIKNSWKLAAKEEDKRIIKVVAKWRSYMPAVPAEAVGAE